MTQFDRITLGRQARELGFVRDTFEKVCRLADVLAFLESDALLSRTLALKGGMKDNLKIEINYMLRAHVLPTTRRAVRLPWNNGELTVLSVAPIEIFASKIVALINRTAARD